MYERKLPIFYLSCCRTSDWEKYERTPRKQWHPDALSYDALDMVFVRIVGYTPVVYRYLIGLKLVWTKDRVLLV